MSVFMCTCTRAHMHTLHSIDVEVRGQFGGVSYLLPCWGNDLICSPLHAPASRGLFCSCLSSCHERAGITDTGHHIWNFVSSEDWTEVIRLAWQVLMSLEPYHHPSVTFVAHCFFTTFSVYLLHLSLISIPIPCVSQCEQQLNIIAYIWLTQPLPTVKGCILAVTISHLPCISSIYNDVWVY